MIKKRSYLRVKKMKSMLTREEVAEIMTYCNTQRVSYKSRLSELGIPEWRFFESKAKYAKEQKEESTKDGEFLRLTTENNTLVAMPSFAAKTGRKSKGAKEPPSKKLHIELRTPNGTMMCIEGDMDQSLLRSIIQASSCHV